MTRGRFSVEEKEIVLACVADHHDELATVNRKVRRDSMDSIYRCCRAKGMNRTRQQVQAKVTALLGSDEGKATLQQRGRRQARRVGHASRSSSGSGSQVSLQTAALEQVAAQQATLKQILQEGQTTMEQVAAQQAAVQVAVEKALKQGQIALEQVSAQQAAIQAAVESVVKQVQDTLEQITAQKAAMQDATLEALDQGQAVLEVASAKQAAMHAAVEHALGEGQSALERVTLQQAAMQAAVQQVALHEAQQGQAAALLDLLPAVGVPVGEVQNVEPEDNLNLDLGL